MFDFPGARHRLVGVMTEPQPNGFMYSFPAVRGIQAGREYYVAMFPLELVPQLLCFEDASLPPEVRAQRKLNKSRVPQLRDYILSNPEDYVFSSLTASVDGQVHFEPYAGNGAGKALGTLTLPMDVRLLINDGQHRMAAIQAALKERPSLGKETISIVLFVDAGLKASQQMFADLNRYAVRPTKSLSVLYDHRDPLARLARDLIETVSVFDGTTETAKTSISNRSRELFTLSSIYQATKRLLNKKKGDEITEDERRLVIDFWEAVGKNMPDWKAVAEGSVSAAELRRDYVHVHGVALQAIAIAGAALIANHPKTWQKKLAKLKQVDWARDNAQLWEGRALVGGRLSKAFNNVILTANALKRVLRLSLSPSEKKVEELYERRNEASR